MRPSGDAARLALIEVAEQLFAERGIESVSLRDISAAAGQRNHSAAQYHFGDRAGLVAAVFEHRMHEVNRRRHALLDALALDDSTDDLERLVDATVRPLVEVVAETNGWYGRFLVRSRWDTFAQQVVADVAVLSSFRRAIALIALQLDEPYHARTDRIDQMATLLIGTVAGWEWRRHRGDPTASPDEFCADMIATCHAVLTARVPTTRASRSRS